MPEKTKDERSPQGSSPETDRKRPPPEPADEQPHPQDTWLRRLWNRTLLSRLMGSLPQPPAGKADMGTWMAEERTTLALERSYLGSERTHIAWIRTALSMISFGFTIEKIATASKEQGGVIKGLFGRTLSVESSGYFLVVTGTVGLILATMQHWARVEILREMGGLKYQLSVSIMIVVLLSIMGIIAFTAMVLKL